MSETRIPDDAFAGAALKLGFVTSAQIEEARAKLAAMRQMNLQATLEDILQRGGMITVDQAKTVRRSLGASVMDIPGYQVLSKLGAGGMGAVFKARQISVDRLVAIKVLSAVLTEDCTFVARFINEAKSAAKLNHPNIISVFDAGESSGVYYFVMEYAEGSPLDHVLKASGALSEKRVREIGAQVAQALRAIHRHQMLHRDIKPGNILIDKRGQVKVCDFGLVRTQGNSGITQSGEVFGTPMYMSPEQINGERNLDIRSDLYSVGATLFCLLTGRAPFLGESPMAIALKHVSEPAPDPRSLKPEISEPMAQLVLKLLEKDPSRRFQNPEELLNALRIGLTQRSVASPRLRLRWLGAAAAALFVTGLVIAYAVIPGRKPLPLAIVEKPKPPPPLKPPEPAKPPEIDPQAASLASDIESNDFSRWLQAEEKLKSLTGTEFDDLRKKVARKIEATRKEEAESAEAARRKFLAKDWEGALKAYEALPAGRPLDLDQLRAMQDSCRAEIAAVKAIDRLLKMESESRWREIQAIEKQIVDSHKETATLRERESEIQALRQRVERELEAEEALAKVRACAVAKEWTEFVTHLKQLEHFRDTRTYAAAAREVAALNLDRETAGLRTSEEKAEATWNRAQLASRDGRLEEAKNLVQTFLAEYVSTEFYKAHKEEARQLLDACDAGIRDAVENAARDILAKIREAQKTGDWNQADKLLQDLSPYEGTAAAAGAQKLLADVRKQLSKFKAIVLRTDFEKGLDSWAGHNDKGKAPQCEEWNDAKEGKRAAKITFFKADPNNEEDVGGAVFRATEGLDPETTEIRVWGKLLGADGNAAAAEVYVLFSEIVPDKSVEVFAAKIVLARGWKEYAVQVSGLECIHNSGGDGTLDLSQVKQIGFMNADKMKTISFSADDFRILKPQK